MRIIMEVGHPAQVHTFKNLIWNLEKNGHTICVATASKDVMIDLIEKYGFDYKRIYDNRGSKLRKLVSLAVGELEMLKLARSFKPDIFFSTLSEVCGPVSRIVRKPNIGFTDTEHAFISHAIGAPCSDLIFTPKPYRKDLGKKQFRFDGCKELAYLHPNYFKADHTALEELGLSEKDNIFLIRLSAFSALHDLRSHNFDRKYIPALIDRLKSEGQIIVSSEEALAPELKKYQFKIHPSRYQDVLYYSKLYVGEGTTIAKEAAVLGVPSLHFERVNVGGKLYGSAYIYGIVEEMQNEYGLLDTFYSEEKLLTRMDEIVSNLDETKRQWMARREKYLGDKIDVTSFLTWFFDQYPDSVAELKRNPDIQYKFR